MARALILALLLLLTGCTVPALQAEPSAPPPTETALETVPETTLETLPETTAPELPDLLTQAEAMSARYGIDILIGEDAAATEPWDYYFVPETDPFLLKGKLSYLESCLSVYPEGMLKVLSQDYGGLHVCVVREIRGRKSTGSLDSANGLQFFSDENENYIVLAEDMEYTLFHELCHVIEDFLLPRTPAWDDWESLNPADFSYDLDFTENADRDGEAYLEDDTRAFVDTYSMSFPREDRARVMEYAMTPGNEDLFRPPIMQSKLQMLCSGIREVFSIPDSTSLLWEQYLTK